MATWLASNPIHHPWFSQPSMKRKLSTPESPSPVSSAGESSSSSPSGSPPPHKRRKHSTLEAGFSNLSLDLAGVSGRSSALNYASEPVSTLSSPYPSMEDDTTPIVLEPSIEEPPTPEVRMKSSSWYEPERDRIVITDLDSSSDEEDNNADPDTASISISRALLKQISSRPRDFTVPPPNQNRALVLFKPMPVAGVAAIVEEPKEKAEKEKIDETASISIDVLEDMVADEDAMDIEP